MNLRDLTDDDLYQEIKTLKAKLAPLTRVWNQRVKAKRPKPAAKPKQRKAVDKAAAQRAAAYVMFREEWQVCWMCNRSPNNRPANWQGVYIIERAHITKDGLGRRIEDVRLINALCSRCHNDHTAGRISTATMIRLKREHDPDNYDPEFLQAHSVRRLTFPT